MTNLKKLKLLSLKFLVFLVFVWVPFYSALFPIYDYSREEIIVEKNDELYECTRSVLTVFGVENESVSFININEERVFLTKPDAFVITYIIVFSLMLIALLSIIIIQQGIFEFWYKDNKLKFEIETILQRVEAAYWYLWVIIWLNLFRIVMNINTFDLLLQIAVYIMLIFIVISFVITLSNCVIIVKQRPSSNDYWGKDPKRTMLSYYNNLLFIKKERYTNLMKKTANLFIQASEKSRKKKEFEEFLKSIKTLK
jgi:hypothetical protein